MRDVWRPKRDGGQRDLTVGGKRNKWRPAVKANEIYGVQ